MANVTGYNRKLATILRRNALIEDAVLQPLVDQAGKEGVLLANLLIAGSHLDEPTLLGLVSEDCGFPPIDLAKLTVSMDEMRSLNGGSEPLSEDLCRANTVLPLAMIGNLLTIAVANPYDVVLLDNLKLQIGRQLMPVVSSQRAIEASLKGVFHAQEQAIAKLMEQSSSADELSVSQAERAEDEEAEATAEQKAQDATLAADEKDSRAVKTAKHIIANAIKMGASDIHIEPFEKKTRVRFRIDGVLQEIMDVPKSLERALVSCLKIMTDTMNIAERGKPQDGRISVAHDGKKCDIRVSSLPLVYGEKVVMRILAKGNLKDMKELNLEPQVFDILSRGLSAPQGMVLVTGPTGSGKSTTLYSCLKTVMTPEENVNTVEDPVEYELEGINQCHVNPKRGLTFAGALRALLRQDPDTIMVGEIRDQETIEIAVKAALTGHLVLSTLHTNDAPSTITRIIDMGIEPLMVASTVNVVLAQRLGRKLCVACKKPMEKDEVPDRDILVAAGFKPEELEGLALFKPVGCSLCSKGYKGRFAIVECLEMNDRLRKIIIGKGSDIEIRRIAIETGMISLRRAALLNAMRGITTVEEAIRQTVADEVGSD